jgi:hypothetical protein
MAAQTSDTESFVAFYQDVTRAIELKIVRQSLPTEQANLLRFLYFGFWREYKPKWLDQPIRDLLKRVQKKASKALQVACQAYLHMAYDLPRVIASALTANPGIGLTSSEMEDTYLLMDDLFERALRVQFKSVRSVGFIAIVAKVLPDSVSPSGIAAVWVLAIRGRSFHNGEKLRQAQLRSLHERERLDDQLKAAVILAIDEVLDHRLNPASWFTFLRSPSIVLPCIAFPIVLSLLTLSVPGNLSHMSLGTKVGVGAVSSASAYAVSFYWGLIRLVKEAGRGVLEAVDKVMGKAELKPFREFER